jgi:hypothetical protein
MIIFFCSYSDISAQPGTVNLEFYDGVAIAGYVDQGGFINFTGPNINFTKGRSKHILGMLPSLRFKEDNGETRNSFVTPNLGVGYTYSFRYFAIQIPLYYNSKTAAENGKWHLGIGLGIRLNEIIKKEKN